MLDLAKDAAGLSETPHRRGAVTMQNTGPRTGNRMQCPHCGTRCSTLKTVQQTEIVREITFFCPECDFAFVAQLVVIRQIAPSNNPKEDLKLPGSV